MLGRSECQWGSGTGLRGVTVSRELACLAALCSSCGIVDICQDSCSKAGH